MRSFGLILLACACALACAPAEAQHCTVRGRVAYVAPTYSSYSYGYSTYAYQAPTVATLLNFAVPSYYVGYSPQGADSQLQIDLLKLKNELLQLRLEQAQARSTLPKKEGVQLPQQQPQNQQQPGQINTAAGGRLKVFSSRCASCHDAAVADKKGDGLVLTRGGQLEPLTYQQSLVVTRVLYTGKTAAGKAMPPAGPLNDEEAGSAIVDPSPMK